MIVLLIALYGLPLALCARLRGYALAGGAFLLGAGAVSLHLFVLSLLGVPWTRTSVLLALAPLLLLSAAFAKRRTGFSPSRRAEARPTWSDLAVFVPIAAYALFALYAPPYEWDYYGIWGIKARWFFDAKGIDWTYLQTHSSHPDYPLLLPLLFDFTAIVSGGWNDLTFGWLYVALCASFILIAREEGGAMAAFAVAFPALNLWVGLAEAPVMAFGCAGLLFLRKERYDLGAVMLGFAAWSKNEGVALIVAAALALLLARKNVLKLWPAIAMIAPWMIVRSVLKLPTDFADKESLLRIWQRLIHPGETLPALATAPPDQPWLWLVILAVILIYARQAWQRERFLLVALLLQSAALVLPLFATPFDLASHAQFSLNRIPHQIAPAAVFLAAVLLIREFQRRGVPFGDAAEHSQNR
ncbi:MAG TPA: hypothetical protein VEO54_15010 [Thermoanaerobaculia bacterium]|nr:hypothetical protein [Thermoanaerobaculia bacterium]